MSIESDPFKIRRSFESIATYTDKWWYLPALSGMSWLFLVGLAFLTSTPVWALETFSILIIFPTTVLAIPAIIFDILNKCGGDTPPGLFLYSPALLGALFIGSTAVITVIVIYLIIWVWPGKTRLHNLLS
ncbi:hypothetical protein [Natrinema ejinorense]|uniref:hypothetical protein n=1 Tax=Natrinema ejinorense TaxID=373386 RepID=UPI0011806CD6|nr:hypothetical protein [Natrinema ejinorense]